MIRPPPRSTLFPYTTLFRSAVDNIVAQQLGTPDAEVGHTLRFVCEVIVPRLERTPDEIANIVRALQGEYVPAGPSGAPTRGLAHVLPTGRNFYSVDPKTLPSQIAYQVGTDLAQCAAHTAAGVADAEARSRSLYRVFGSKPGTYGAGILPLLDERNWRNDRDLAEVYVAWGGYAYTQETYGAEASRECKARFAEMAIAVKNQDNREHDIFDSDDYMQYHGGMVATVRALTGRNPKAYFGDSSDPSRSRVRELADEARRVFRTRVVNPKWVQSMQRHGYKGAFEMAATVDYLFGYDATAHVVEDWMYTQLTDQYVLDPQVQQFFQEKNPWALRNIIERLMEAVQRGLWEQPDEVQLAQMRQVYLQLEGELEDRMDTTQPSGGQ